MKTHNCSEMGRTVSTAPTNDTNIPFYLNVTIFSKVCCERLAEGPQELDSLFFLCLR